MLSFKFHVPTKLLSGPDAVAQLPVELASLGATRAFIVTDPGIVCAGLLRKITDVLDKGGVAFEVFDQVEPNPRDSTILAGAEQARELGADAMVALGGGSPIDAAKAMAVMAANEGPLVQYCGAGADPWPVLPVPIVAIPTTAGTGAEVSGAAMINLVAESRKADIFGQSIRPVTAILDPVLTVGLPPGLTASTGIDALSHALEAYVALYANPITDALAEQAMRLVADNLHRVTFDGVNLEARGHMLLASAMAVMAAGAGLGVIHSLAQTIGGFYDAPHGLSIAACFPLGMRYNLSAAPEKFARIAQLLGADVAGLSPSAAAEAAVPALEALLRDLGITSDLKDLGARQADIPRLAELAMLDGCTPTNPRPIDEAGFAALFARGLE
ncbi:MAG: iron-containing alcohol dehydrogenase [Anaerolineae bacterium]|jgi:alcohol dehydrogenase class IV